MEKRAGCRLVPQVGAFGLMFGFRSLLKFRRESIPRELLAWRILS